MALTNPYPYNAAYIPPIEIDPQTSTDPTIIVNRLPNYNFITSTPGSPQLMHAIVKSNIRNVGYSFNQRPGSAYPWKTLTQLIITMHEGDDYTFELQTVDNQTTWNDGTEASCIAAVTAINASL